MRIEGATFMVTGSNRGIGRAIVGELAARGAHILAGTRSGASHPDRSSSIVPVAMDLSSRESIDASIDALAAHLPGIDGLVNNAGAFAAGQLEHQDIDRIYELFQTNLVGLAHLTRRVLPAMLERGSGKIVNHASLVGYFNFPGISIYAASKAGVTAFTESLRRELQGTGVTTLEIVTGGVDTDMLRSAAGDLQDHTSPKGWQWMDPTNWAERIVDAIENDKHVLQPPGKARLGKSLSAGPSFLLDAVAARGFERR
jgi:short-subunit dehydrogenase